MTDPYELLGVSRSAAPDEIKRSYRKLARELHPDANPGDPAAEARFKEISAAYEILSDPEKRRRFDRFGTTGGAGGGDPFSGFGSVSDIFDAFFGGQSPFGGSRGGSSGPPRGVDLEVVAEVEFVEAVFGGETSVTVRSATRCETCDGTGAAEGTSPISCVRCGGAGQVRQVRQSFLGQVVSTAVCPECSGLGEVVRDPCGDCRGEGRTIGDVDYQVRVPPGIDDGATLRLTGRGAVGPRGGSAGDLYVHVRVRPHDRFVRRGADLHEEIEVALTQATLGARLAFSTLDAETDHGEDGLTELVVEPGTQSGDVVRLRGRGVPRLEGRGRGDLVVSLRVVVPHDLDERQEELLRELAELRGEAVAEAPEGGLFSRLRSAFR